MPQRLWVHNKADLLPPSAPAPAEHALRVSARTGAGLDALHAALREHATGEQLGAGAGAFTARARHVDALRRAGEETDAARGELAAEALELAAEAFRGAHDALGEITGKVGADALLGHIFASFCIGK